MSFNRLGSMLQKFLGRTAFSPFQNRSFRPSTFQVQNGLRLPAGKNGYQSAVDIQSCSRRLQETLRFFRTPNDAAPCDVTICIEGTEKTKAELFKAHKLVLGLFSQRFRETWSADLQPKPDGPDNVLRFSSVEPHAFAIMLRYMYADDTSDLTMENAMDLLFCANFFKADKLTQICRDFIEISLTAGNACHVLQQARVMNEERLAQLALSVICKSPDDTFASPEFLQLAHADLKTILVRDDLNMPEHLIYQHVRRWALTRMCAPDSDGKNNLRDAVGDLRSAIRFPLFDKESLDSGPLKDGVVTLQELAEASSSVRDPSLCFRSTPRQPVPAPFYISCQIGCDAFGSDQPDQFTDRVVIELRPEFAPQTCAFARKLLELAHTSGQRCNVRLVPYDGFFIDCEHSETTLEPPETLTQETSILSRTVAGAVCFGWEGNHCLIDRARGFKQGSGEPECGIWLASEKPDGGAVFGRVVHGLELLKMTYGHFLAGNLTSGGITYWTTNWCLHKSFPVKVCGDTQIYDDMEDVRPEETPEWSLSETKEFKQHMIDRKAREKVPFEADP